MQTSRDIRIDFVRGLCLPLMMIDQLRLGDHWLGALTDRPLEFFSVMAVIVFLAGFVVVQQ